MKKHKIDCNCCICKSKRGEAEGKNNPNYKDGKTLIQHYCIDCGKKIEYKNKRCRPCDNTYRWKGKTYEEIHGIKKAKKLRKLRSIALTGKSKSKQHKKNISLSKIGKPSTFKGKHHSEESKKQISLSHGGTGIPYEDNEYSQEFRNVRELIRERDSHICQNPNCNCTEKENGRLLDVHHIDYNKENCEETNLISLCHKCHSKTLVNRKYWIKYFIEIINKIYQLV